MRETQHLTTVFDDQTSFRARGFAGRIVNRNFAAVFADQTPFRSREFAGRFANRNFTSVFGDRTTFRASASANQNRNFISVFGDRTAFRAEKVALGQAQIKIAILFQCLAIKLNFVRKGCHGNPEISILPQFLTIEPRFMQKGAPGRQKAIRNRSFTSVVGDRTSFRAKGCVS